MSKGIYVDADGRSVRFFGTRKQADPAGMAWHDGLNAKARQLLESLDSYRFLRWDGSTVVMRSRTERDTIAATDLAATDDEWFDGERRAALVEAVVSVINSLETGSTITAPQVRTAYKLALGR